MARVAHCGRVLPAVGTNPRIAAAMVLFPDGREPFGEGSPWEHLRRTIRDRGGHLFGDRPCGVFAPGDMSADEALSLISSINWHHPMSVMYQEFGENRWSYVAITGPSRTGRYFEGAE